MPHMQFLGSMNDDDFFPPLRSLVKISHANNQLILVSFFLFFICSYCSSCFDCPKNHGFITKLRQFRYDMCQNPKVTIFCRKLVMFPTEILVISCLRQFVELYLLFVIIVNVNQKIFTFSTGKRQHCDIIT